VHAARVPDHEAQTPRGGRIINNGSISAHAPRPNSAPYTATKHAITGLTKVDLARRPQARHRLRADRHRQRRAPRWTARMAEGVTVMQADGSSCRRAAHGRPARRPAAVVYMASLPLDANVQFMTVMATQDAVRRAKARMFDELGEIEIFRKVGLTPVFFGRTVIGPRMPNFVYMLVHDDMAARERSWDAFRTSPDWKALAATPGYSDTEIVSNITTIFLRPGAASQV
jgi:hypothetical protein